MTNAEEPFCVGVIGSSATSRYVCERLSLRDDLRVVTTWTEQNEQGELQLALAGVAASGCRRHATPFDVINDSQVGVLYFADGSNADWMQLALGTSKPIVVESPQSLFLSELERLAREAVRSGQVATIYEPRRWETDFLQARSALDSGRLGQLRRVRYSVYDYRLPDETYPRGVPKELGSHVLDQLLQLTGPDPCRRADFTFFPSWTDRSDGFLCRCDFSVDLSAIIEIQTRSLLSYRSGWMLEGTIGAYRNGRLYTQTADGEIIDEPLPTPGLSSDPFFDALSLSLRGTTSDLPTIQDSVRVAALLAESDVETK
jgi:predicted dehydrogenase